MPGCLALLAPRPTLLGTALFDFFPIEGARESFAEAKRLFEIAGAGERIDRAEAAEHHGLTRPLRLAIYRWFDRWLAGRNQAGPVEEIPVTPRSAQELLVCAEGQINRTFRRATAAFPALDEFDRRPKPPRANLRELLRLDPELANPVIEEPGLKPGKIQSLILCVNGNEARDWREEAAFLRELGQADRAVFVLDPRGAGRSRSRLSIAGRGYADAVSGVEENIAYNAFLVGKSLLGMRVTDVIAGFQKLHARWRPERFVVCGRRDAAVVALLAAAVEPLITHVAVEEMLLSFRSLFSAQGTPISRRQRSTGAARAIRRRVRDHGSNQPAQDPHCGRQRPDRREGPVDPDGRIPIQ